MLIINAFHFINEEKKKKEPNVKMMININVDAGQLDRSHMRDVTQHTSLMLMMPNGNGR